jgi:hypothetical protein
MNENLWRTRWAEHLPEDHWVNETMADLAEQSAIEQAEKNAAFDRLRQLDELRAFAEQMGIENL